jgi:2-polyprenyl-3-methyl-5-hydroxy-6-metoxy-1,4-benzoquinol methylase
MQTSRLFRQDPIALARKALSRGVYTLRTGYWHTPERCCPDFPDEIFENQLKVYKFAAQFCKEKAVLDVGCGTGYGTWFLAESAEIAVGIDISTQALNFAQRRYKRDNLQFRKMSAERLDFKGESFDFILSTENFEHLQDHQANLDEMARVLTDEGSLLLATPNAEMFVGIENRYHTHEFSFSELLQVVTRSFRECVISENLFTPPTESGRSTLARRREQGAYGINLSLHPFLWGEKIDTTCLSNTHSFFCFARGPRREL